ncbi:MAG TPA: thioredoxin domain-containing protein [Candidatus Saccharimonadales bacterium]|nr:thioredoxin domain-containing protein [Candidatus Saccharimonadales bacterium]
MDKRFWGFLAVIALVLGGIFFFTNSNQASAPTGQAGTLTNHVKGQGASGVTLTEYGDFQCPACGQYYPLVKQLYQKYQGDIKLQFRNFPLFQIHPNAIAASRAAEAADLQGKFWEMHDMLYENQQSWSPSQNPQSSFEQYARELGLNVEKFKTDYKSNQVNDRVQADLREGQRLDVSSTPTFFIDGKKISNPTSLEDFSKVIENAIKQKTGKKPSPAASESATEATTEVTTPPTPAPAEGQ